MELNCRHDDDALRLCPRDPQRNEEDDDNGNEDDAAVTTDADSFLEAEDQGGSNVSADDQGQEFLLDASNVESTYHRTSGSSRASGLATGTTTVCNTNTKATPNTVPPCLPPTTVITQPREGEERDVGWGEATTSTLPLRRAAQNQRELLGRLIRDNQL